MVQAIRERQRRPPFVPRTVLIVDDDADVRSCMRMLFEDEGHFVVEAENGVQALRALAVIQADLVLVDWWMPTMGGERFLRVLKDTGMAHELQVVVLSGASDLHPLEGATVLQKPVEPGKLLELAARPPSLH